jgi:hypothetical protein
MTNDMKLDVRRSGRRFEAERCSTLLPMRKPGHTITDYDELPSFMRASRLSCDCVGCRRRRPSIWWSSSTANSVPVRPDDDVRLSRASCFAWRRRSNELDLGLFRRRAIDVFEGRAELTALGALRAPRTLLRYRALIGLLACPAARSRQLRFEELSINSRQSPEIARRSGRRIRNRPLVHNFTNHDANQRRPRRVRQCR